MCLFRASAAAVADKAAAWPTGVAEDFLSVAHALTRSPRRDRICGIVRVVDARVRVVDARVRVVDACVHAVRVCLDYVRCMLAYMHVI